MTLHSRPHHTHGNYPRPHRHPDDLPHYNQAHSLPSSPFPREQLHQRNSSTLLSAQDVDLALHHARLDMPGLNAGRGGDYFSETAPLSTAAAATASQHYNGSGGGGGGTPGVVVAGTPGSVSVYRRNSHEGIMGMVRRTNLAAALANGSIPALSSFAQLHPMMTSDGQFPAELAKPKTVQAFRILDSTTLDRILSAYGLPHSISSLLAHASPPSSSSSSSSRHGNHHRHASSSSSSTSSALVSLLGSGGSRGEITSKEAKQIKVLVLLEFLGATRIVERERERERLRERERR
ncbi:MAG: hypothetical protein M4579_005825 [Chaenotheca gracillima]|nr:MAG: hypothetical protein M4579_005825 [Chaenotheca gracillima]